MTQLVQVLLIFAFTIAGADKYLDRRNRVWTPVPDSRAANEVNR